MRQRHIRIAQATLQKQVNDLPIAGSNGQTKRRLPVAHQIRIGRVLEQQPDNPDRVWVVSRARDMQRCAATNETLQLFGGSLPAKINFYINSNIN